MKFLIAVLLLLPGLSYADCPTFGTQMLCYFNGKYKVQTRSCKQGDTICTKIQRIELGFDNSMSHNFLIETDNDGTKRKIWMSEDIVGDTSHYITGAYGTNTNWTESSPEGTLEVNLSWSGHGYPLTYSYSQFTSGGMGIQRKFVLIAL